MKPIFQIAAAAAMLALGACSSAAVDSGSMVAMAPTGAAAALPAGVPAFAASSAALPAILAQGKATKVTYVARGQAPIISGSSGYCPYASGVYTAAAAPLRSVDGSRNYRFTNY